MPVTSLNVGGLVAVGLDPSGRYLLTVSHAGRGVFDMENWCRVARDADLAYPIDGLVIGIGPISNLQLPVIEIDYDTGILSATTLDGKLCLSYAEGIITIENVKPKS